MTATPHEPPDVDTPIYDQLAQDYRDGLAGPLPEVTYADEQGCDPGKAGSSPEEPPPGVDAPQTTATQTAG